MKAIYQTRREDFMHSDSCPYLTILYSGKAPVRSADETYRFSVERNFYYMTGIDLENAVLVMIRESDTKVYSNLYLNLRDEETAKWIGGSPSSEHIKRYCETEHEITQSIIRSPSFHAPIEKAEHESKTYSRKQEHFQKQI